MPMTMLAQAQPGLTRSLAAAPAWAKVAAVLAGTAVLAASARITVPMWPVPMTMQTYALLVIGALYGSRLGAATVLAYLAEGAIGLPVFAAGGGLHHFFGTTGGFLLGFPLVAFLAGFFMERGWGRTLLGSAAGFTIAHLAVFVTGVPFLAGLIGWDKAIALGFLPFVAGTVVKTGLAMATYEVALRLPSRRG
ncbi:biotin transporter BioY [Prosthecomicrobium sp. N25]|uniref:biotin transporter BioY n=1 Tax=Prosthecomicrobium sp. N25 TaxID=3129254 RepID=UPI003077B73E